MSRRRPARQRSDRGNRGSLVDEVQQKVAERVSLHAGYWLAWGEQFENLEAARQRLMVMVPVCFLSATAVLQLVVVLVSRSVRLHP